MIVKLIKKKQIFKKCCFLAALNMTAYPKMANIANILPVLVMFCKEITKHFGCDIFLVFYIQKTYSYVIAYLRCP